jgi:transposase
MATMATSAFHGSRVIVVALHTRSFPSDAEWDDYLAIVRAAFARHGATGLVRGLAITDGGGPTARQRTLLVDMLQDEKAIGSVVTSSRLALGIGRALSWVHPEIKTFSPRDYPRALRHIGLPDEEWPALSDHLAAERVRIHVDALMEIDAQWRAAAR